MPRNKFNSESARKAAAKRKGTKNRKTIMWNKLGEFLVDDGAEIYLRNLKEMMDDADARTRMAGMNMYKDTVEYFKPKLSRTELKHDGEQKLDISVRFEEQPE